MRTIVKRVSDFQVNGAGDDPAWLTTEWLPMVPVGGSSTYTSRAKVLYSDSGLYFLVDNEDAQLTCSDLPDFGDLFAEDVVEVFLWPYEAHPVYFEYEISPLNAELPIMVTNHQGSFYGWLPWHYDGPRCTRHATWIREGEKKPMAAVQGWRTEFFIPFALFTGLGKNPPTPGSTWRGNIYRIDYDGDKPAQWAWCPDTGGNFHLFEKFGVLEFAE